MKAINTDKYLRLEMMSIKSKNCSSRLNATYNLIIIFYLAISSASYQNDFCPRHIQVDKELIERRDALKGMNISVGLQNYALDNKTGKPGTIKPHIAVAVFDEISRRAGFSWKNSYGVVDPPTINQTWTDMMHITIDRYDLALDWWNRLVPRAAEGVLYPELWLDTSLIMIRKKQSQQVQVKLFAFMAPFTHGLWALIIFTLVISGLVYNCVEFMTCRRYNKKKETSLGDSIFHSFEAFTGHSNLNPKSIANRPVLLSLLFFCLIIIESYTANLTAFIVNKNNIITINNFEDVVLRNFPICFWRGGGVEEQLIKKYPYATYVAKDNELEIFQGVRNGNCEIGLIPIFFFESSINDRKYNPECNIEWVGRQVTTDGASFTIKDSQYLCTSLLRDVLDIHLLEMKQNGTLDSIIEAQKVLTLNCAESKCEDSEQLNSSDLGGIFIIHYIILIASAFFALWQVRYPHILSEAHNLYDSVKERARRLSNELFMTKDELKEEEEINVDDTSNSEVDIHHASKTQQNTASMQRILNEHKELKLSQNKLSKEVYEMKEVNIKLLERIEKLVLTHEIMQ